MNSGGWRRIRTLPPGFLGLRLGRDVKEDVNPRGVHALQSLGGPTGRGTQLPTCKEPGSQDMDRRIQP